MTVKQRLAVIVYYPIKELKMEGKFEKAFLKQTLENVLAGLNSKEVERHNWYASLYPEEMDPFKVETDEEQGKRCSYEDILAIEAIKHPELHLLMEQVVARITEIGESGRFKQIWESDQEQAGGCLARELAVYSKEYIPLYYRYIQTNDLDHELNQDGDMGRIFHKWSYGPEIMQLLLYRGEWGQQAWAYEDYADGICESEEDAEVYLSEAIRYFAENWDFEEKDEEDDEDIESLKEKFTPLFAELFDLDDDQMARFALAFNNAMAKNKPPTIAKLLKAAKKK